MSVANSTTPPSSPSTVPDRLFPESISSFSQKKFSKLLVDAEDYLKDTSFDTNLKTEWSEKEKRMQAELDSKSQSQSKIRDEIRETEAEFEEAG